MAIKLGEGFEITGYDPIDFRLVLTKEQMSKIVGDEDSGSNPDDFAMPEKYFAFCIDDGFIYGFDYNADIDPETGKFRKLELGGNVPKVEVGDTAPANPEVGDKWLDTSTTPPTEKEWDGTQWVTATPAAGEMIYDATNNVILYFDGTEWKPIGGGVEHQSSVGPTDPGTAGDIIYDETAGEFKTIEKAENGDTKDVWVSLAKVWEGTTAQFNALDSTGDGLKWSQRHPDVIVFITD